MRVDPIHIVCGIDANYAPHLAVMLRSLVATNPSRQFHVHVLQDNVPLLLQAKVESSVPSVTFDWLHHVDHPALKLVSNLSHISRASFLRLMITELLPATIDRVLYLDVDLIILADIGELWATDMKDYPCAAVVDACISATHFATTHGLQDARHYFNSGVMLLNMNALRENDYLERAVRLLANPATHYAYADQDGLNIVFWNHWLALDASWNFQRGFFYNHAAAWYALKPTHRPRIVHFTEAEKPWLAQGWNPCRWLYLRHARHTPFYEGIVREGGYTWWRIVRAWLRWHLKRPAMFR